MVYLRLWHAASSVGLQSQRCCGTVRRRPPPVLMAVLMDRSARSVVFDVLKHIEDPDNVKFFLKRNSACVHLNKFCCRQFLPGEPQAGQVDIGASETHSRPNLREPTQNMPCTAADFQKALPCREKPVQRIGNDLFSSLEPEAIVLHRGDSGVETLWVGL